ncbi:SusC/RagA family TonB-linked outer membrane protein [Runella limosa]|uniref:SusC/RagA family TonB-linked outer membrane protein n=1 Tax=Runella limosa TaxID=370978 RepID=UPI001B7F82E3|nr:TonB-dependent receptor [Runella limosa]
MMKTLQQLTMKTLTSTLLLLLVGFVTVAQNKLTGKVSDEKTKEGIPGVSIAIKGTSQGATTDMNGQFTLAVSSNATLVISSVGYETKEVAYTGQATLNISLSEAANELAQVVVVGYGTQRKVDITGATSSIKGEDLAKQPVMTPTQAIQGKVAGVQIISSGRPGSSPNIRIRGTGTALAGTATLFVVDGVLTDDISNINTADITNVDILKDASSTAIYGSRGANGVVIITTKKGVSGKLSVNYNNQIGARQAANLVKMANATEYANYLSAASGRPIQAGTTSTDWYGQILRTAMMQNHNLSISGGSEKATHYLSLGYLTDEGIVINNIFKRFTARLNNDFTLHPKLKIGLMTSYANSRDQNVNLGAAYNNAYRAAPIIPAVENGLYGNTSLYQNVGNAVLDIKNNDDLTLNNRLQGAGYVEFKPLTFLTFRSSMGGDLIFSNQRVYNYQFNNDGTTFIQPGGNQRNPNSNLTSRQTNLFRWVWDNTVSFNKQWNDHTFGVMVGTTAEAYSMNTFSAYRRDVPAASNLWYINTGNANTSTNSGDGDKWARNSYISRANYNFKDKYLLTATLRADGSSRFPIQNRWGYFPSVGLGWVLSEESFMQGQHLFETLKIRASWGRVGNDRIDSDGYLVTVEPNLAYAFGGGTATLGSAITQIKDPNLKWETTEEMDLGLEFSAMNGRLQGEFGFYDKKSRNLLINVKVPSVTGDKDGVVLTNAASIRNTGLEAMLNWRDKISSTISYRIGANATFNKNSVIGLNGGQPILDGGIGAAQQYTTKTDNGQPVGSFYVLQVLGVFQTDDEISAYKNSKGQVIQPGASAGDFKYQDTNDDGRIDDADRVFAGSYQPKVFFGINLGFTYKSFDFSADAIGNLGNVVYNGKKAFRQALLDNVERSMAYGRWTRGSGIQTEPAANAGNLPASTYFIESGNFIRLNNVTLSYSLPAATLQKAHIGTARVFITAQNIFTLKKYTGFTPELPGDPTRAGIELNAYPTTKTLAVGINVGF